MDPQFRYRVHGRSSRTDEDDGLHFLSREEQECLQFFENTIDSLEVSLEESDQGELKPARSRDVEEVDGRLATTPSPSAMLSTLQSRFHSNKDHDIIDLVRPQPDVVQSRAVDFDPTHPDFQNMVPTPGSHLEMNPRYDPMDSLSSESNIPVAGGHSGSTDSQASLYQPPGCIPTPVLIAQKIAENHTSGTSNSQPSSAHRRWSEEYEKPSSPSTDLPSKQGPPTSAKPTRYPANINVILSSKEHQNHPLSNVNLQERRAQMLANLTGSHPLLQEEASYTADQKDRSVTRRSVSFRDPTPDKSRMEALSKLGLTRNRAMSGGMSLLVTPKTPSQEPEEEPLEVNVPESSLSFPQVNVTTSNQSQAGVHGKSEIPRRHSSRRENDSPSHLLPPAVPQTNYQPPAVPQANYHPPAVPQTNYHPPAVPQTNYHPPAVPQTNYHPPAVPKTNYQPPAVPKTNYQPPAVPQTNYHPPAVPQTNYHPPAAPKTNYHPPAVPKTNYHPPAFPKTNYYPPAVPQANYHPPPLETTASVAPHPEVTSLEFNSYGGKSIVVKPTTSSKTEPPTSPTSPNPKMLPPALANPTEFNTYGGKSKTINPAPVVLQRNELPDILSSHMDKTQSLPSRSDPLPSRSDPLPSRSDPLPSRSDPLPSRTSSKKEIPPNLTRSVKAPAPPPAPRPARNSYHGPVSTQKPAQRSVSPQFRRKPATMFPSQGITVQFSGRGATEESRKDALRKLGLLKDS